MFEMIMTFCLLGQPCRAETVATFPQWDVGREVCELARPGVEMGIRAKVAPGTRVSFVCREVSHAGADNLAPREGVTFAKDGAVRDVLPQFIELLKKVTP